MTAEILSVGTELLLGQIVDTHAATMGKILADCGITCQRRGTVGDNFDRIVGMLKESLARVDVVVTIGGLGPTLDDLTRDAIARALDDELEVVPEIGVELRELFQRRNLRWSDTILRQAEKPRCAQIIPNDHGTAPGLICQRGGKTVVALPGPKGEFEPMAHGRVREFLSQLSGEVIHSVLLRIVNMGESHVEEMVKHLMDSACPTVAPYAQLGEVHLRVTAKAKTREEAQVLIDPVVEEIRAIFGDNVLPFQSDSLEDSLLEVMRLKSLTVAVAESMTGGELGARLSVAPGSSQVFAGGVIVYTLEAKKRLLSLDPEELASKGPVSSEVCGSLASRVRDLLGTTFGVAIVGNAGPTSDVGDRPVGLVYVAVAGPKGVVVREQTYRATRADTRRRATQLAMTWLRDEALAL
jgi:nicotinamide-nucleotide amidase